MEKRKEMNIVVATLICLALVGVLIFISINNKVNMDANNVNDSVSTESRAVAQSGDMVAMNYTGRLSDGTVFDSNVDPKFGHVEPYVFPLGAGQVIPGWDKGIVGMKVGEKKTLTISPEDAYGATGVPGVIPPNATLIFEVELLAINK
ncbi:MAG: FKBP-type peptidyl-prolyl cis-trans isomerase [Minisyncoccia bacterium]